MYGYPSVILSIILQELLLAGRRVLLEWRGSSKVSEAAEILLLAL